MNEPESSLSLDRLAAYADWLGILPHNMPPNKYELIGLALFESDADRIRDAVDVQLAKVKLFVQSDQTDLAISIMKELDEARSCLGQDESRAQYDDQLRKELGINALPTDFWPPAADDQVSIAQVSDDQLSDESPAEEHEHVAPVLKPAASAFVETVMAEDLASGTPQSVAADDPRPTSEYDEWPVDAGQVDCDSGKVNPEGEAIENSVKAMTEFEIDRSDHEDSASRDDKPAGHVKPGRRGRRDNFAVQMVMIVIGGIVGLGIGYLILQLIQGAGDGDIDAARQNENRRDQSQRTTPRRNDPRNRIPRNDRRNDQAVNARPQVPSPRDRGSLSDVPNVSQRNTTGPQVEPSTPVIIDDDTGGEPSDRDPDNNLDAETVEPFQPRRLVLTDAADLSKWSGDLSAWSLEDGELVGRIEEGQDTLYLEFDEVFEDFRLAFELRLVGDQGAAGIGIRTREIESGVTAGRELDISVPGWGQVVDIASRTVVVRPDERPPRKRDRWNSFDMIIRGNRARISINKERCIDCRDQGLSLTGKIRLRIDSTEGPTEVRFRDMRLTTIEPIVD